jgi:hypothetical protein
MRREGAERLMTGAAWRKQLECSLGGPPLAFCAGLKTACTRLTRVQRQGGRVGQRSNGVEPAPSALAQPLPMGTCTPIQAPVQPQAASQLASQCAGMGSPPEAASPGPSAGQKGLDRCTKGAGEDRREREGEGRRAGSLKGESTTGGTNPAGRACRGPGGSPFDAGSFLGARKGARGPKEEEEEKPSPQASREPPK